jgi:predicted metal-dependent peptidase
VGLADRQDKYRQALLGLERRQAYIAAEVMALGRPRWVEGAGTAYVTARDNQILLGFDPAWFDRLNWMELMGVLIHEAIRVVYRHVFARPPHDLWAAHRYNLACDAVINDLIARFYPEIPLPGQPVTGEALIGRNTWGMTVEQVLALLRDMSALRQCVLIPLDDHSFWGMDSDDNISSAAKSQELLGQLMEIVECWARDDGWGTEALGQLREAPELRREIRFNLERLLLEKIAARLKPETHWVPPGRRLAAWYPELLLPTYTLHPLRQVLLALDASGSVSAELLGVFTKLSRRRLEACQVEAISFDTEAYPFTPSDPSARPRGGGGTSFDAIEQFSRSRARYPDVVVVFTDGQAPRPTLLHPERWLWCRTRAAPSHAVQGLGERITLPL